MTAATSAAHRDLVVLKFGGSVLTDLEGVVEAVLEIHRWRRRGSQVIAVVSALAGRTDALIAQADSAGITDSLALAGVVARGEHESARLLADQLWEAGIGARVLTPAEIELLASGPPLDATLVSLRLPAIWRALAEDEVVVIPGFVAVNSDGRTVLLGRGGSDLTALFLAHQLSARCRLLKDVDGLYESNPAVQALPRPRRYRSASFNDALATDGSILQHKAVRFAQDHALPFEVGACGRTAVTQIGRSSEFATVSAAPKDARPTRIALLGCGTIGSEVARALLTRTAKYALVGIAVENPERDRASWIPRELLCTSAAALTRSPEVVIELLGLVPGVADAVHRALLSGADVVTANKGWLAKSGSEWTGLARRLGRTIRFSAAVGGAVPVLETIASFAAKGRGVRSIRAITNTTANVVLDAIGQGIPFETALEDARLRGLAESDASRDLDGSDAADKLAVLALLMADTAAGTASIERDRIDLAGARIASSICRTASEVRALGRRLRQVAVLLCDDAGLTGRVSLEAVATDDPLHGVEDDRNRFVLQLDDGSIHIVDGRGAGPRPTVTAILGDLEDVLFQRDRADSPIAAPPRTKGVSHAV
jgi:homoserine dehydrogenase